MEVVIYTQRVELIDSYDERRDCADQRIADFLSECGFIPIPVPNREQLAERIIGTIKPIGIMLTGGNSLEKYGGNAPERDSMDRKLIELAIQNSIPLYAFCRGMQSILSYFENELINVEGHVAVRHFVTEGSEYYEVNSYHNQACKELKTNCGLIAVAQSADKVIEAVRHETLPIMATMWHPEREEHFAEKDIERVKQLFLSGTA